MMTQTAPKIPVSKPPLAPGLKFVRPVRTGKRFLFYGTGGIGKTTLAASIPGEQAWYDLDESLGKLSLDRPCIQVDSWAGLRHSLAKEFPPEIKNIIIDPINVAEEWACSHIVEHVKTESGERAERLEDFGWGKDIRYVYEEFLNLLADLDKHMRQGRNIILLAHVCKPEELNPEGQNYLRYEPRLRSSKKGENSIRLKVKEWCDFVGFIQYDVTVFGRTGNKKENIRVQGGGKAVGSGTRTMYLTEEAHFMAKNRGCAGPIVIKQGNEGEVWEQLLK